MLRPLQLVLSLARLWPRFHPPRRPVPVVWYDVRWDARAAANLRALAVRCTAEGSPPPAATDHHPWGTSDARATAACGAGWSGVVFSRSA